jgi:hypothetical protein
MARRNQELGKSVLEAIIVKDCSAIPQSSPRYILVTSPDFRARLRRANRRFELPPAQRATSIRVTVLESDFSRTVSVSFCICAGYGQKITVVSIIAAAQNGGFRLDGTASDNRNGMIINIITIGSFAIPSTPTRATAPCGAR